MRGLPEVSGALVRKETTHTGVWDAIQACSNQIWLDNVPSDRHEKVTNRRRRKDVRTSHGPGKMRCHELRDEHHIPLPDLCSARLGLLSPSSAYLTHLLEESAVVYFSCPFSASLPYHGKSTLHRDCSLMTAPSTAKPPFYRTSDSRLCLDYSHQRVSRSASQTWCRWPEENSASCPRRGQRLLRGHSRVVSCSNV